MNGSKLLYYIVLGLLNYSVITFGSMAQAMKCSLMTTKEITPEFYHAVYDKLAIQNDLLTGDIFSLSLNKALQQLGLSSRNYQKNGHLWEESVKQEIAWVTLRFMEIYFITGKIATLRYDKSPKTEGEIREDAQEMRQKNAMDENTYGHQRKLFIEMSPQERIALMEIIKKEGPLFAKSARRVSRAIGFFQYNLRGFIPSPGLSEGKVHLRLDFKELFPGVLTIASTFAATGISMVTLVQSGLLSLGPTPFSDGVVIGALASVAVIASSPIYKKYHQWKRKRWFGRYNIERKLGPKKKRKEILAEIEKDIEQASTLFEDLKIESIDLNLDNPTLSKVLFYAESLHAGTVALWAEMQSRAVQFPFATEFKTRLKKFSDTTGKLRDSKSINKDIAELVQQMNEIKTFLPTLKTGIQKIETIARRLILVEEKNNEAIARLQRAIAARENDPNQVDLVFKMQNRLSELERTRESIVELAGVIAVDVNFKTSLINSINRAEIEFARALSTKSYDGFKKVVDELGQFGLEHEALVPAPQKRVSKPQHETEQATETE